jgi:biofilm protein TabA
VAATSIMIADRIGSATAAALKRIHPIMKTALSWIETMPVETADGRIDFDGDDLYVNVHGYPTRRVEECQWESHRHTIDLQYCISGAEVIECLPQGTLRPVEDYSAVGDVEHWHAEGEASRIRMMPGTFVIFLPNELHRPQLPDMAAKRVRKLVFKIRATLLDL